MNIRHLVLFYVASFGGLDLISRCVAGNMMSQKPHGGEEGGPARQTEKCLPGCAFPACAF